MSYSSRFRAATTRDGLRESDPFDISNIGWTNLESRFEELILQMDAPANGINALAARAAHTDKVASVLTQMLDRAQEESRRLLAMGNGEAAAEAGLKTLRLKERFYGKANIKLVPSYFHLARTNQFLERNGDAEEMLSLAHFIILKNPSEVSTPMKAELHQTFGLLYAADDKLDAAVKHLTCATYYLSVINGPEHVLTTFGYFDLANVFATKASMEAAMALYDTVKNVWYTYLKRVLKEIVDEAVAARAIKRYEDDEVVQEKGYASARSFGKDNLTDVSKMLHGIYGIQKERFTSSHPSTGQAQFILGLFLLWVSNQKEAERHLRAARRTSQKFYGERHPVVQEIEEWCHWFDIPLQSDNTTQEQHVEPCTENPVLDQEQQQQQQTS